MGFGDKRRLGKRREPQQTWADHKIVSVGLVALCRRLTGALRVRLWAEWFTRRLAREDRGGAIEVTHWKG